MNRLIRAPGIVLARALLLTMICAGLAAASESKPEDKEGVASLLNESQVVITIPDGFAQIADYAFCDQAYESLTQGMVICVMLRPLSRMQIDYDDPHSSAPNPNQVFPLLFESMLNQLSDYSNQTIQAFELEYAAQHFFADWAQAASFSLKKTMGFPHQDALLIALHKDHVADAYLLVSYNEPQRAKEVFAERSPILRFIEE